MKKKQQNKMRMRSEANVQSKSRISHLYKNDVSATHNFLLCIICYIYFMWYMLSYVQRTKATHSTLSLLHSCEFIVVDISYMHFFYFVFCRRICDSIW